MTKREAVEIIMAAKRAAARVNDRFEIDRAKLGRFGFSSREMDQIETAITRIETFIAGEMMQLDS